MPRDLFGDVTDPSIKVGSRKWYTVPLSLAVHSLVLLTLVVVPLLASGALPMPHDGIAYVPVASPALPAPPPAPRARTDNPPPVNRDAAPYEAPDTITKEVSVVFGFEDGVEEGTGVEELGVVHGIEALHAPPPPPPAQPPKVRAGGDIKRPEKIHDVAPGYPQLALISRIEGMVIIEATIDVDGRVQDARVLRSDSPLLDQAALGAVRQWGYTPTRLNGQPVSVIMTVTVHFQLQ